MELMKAMVLDGVKDLEKCGEPLRLAELPVPEPGEGEVLIKVKVCGVCHTELDEIEGRTAPAFYPIVPGHQAVGKIIKTGKGVDESELGKRVGVAWIFSACGKCRFCREGRENLCDDFKATGRDAHGGYAEYMTASAKYVHLIPYAFSDAQAAPLLCAGAIGYRSILISGLKNGENLGLTGFGASAHLVFKMVKARYPDSPVYVFTRSEKERKFALQLGADWAGGISDISPERMHKIIDTTPAWEPMVQALGNLEKGGKLVINAIRKEVKDRNSLLQLDYPQHLWLEKQIQSVANVTANDVKEFLELAAGAGIKPEYQEFSLVKANEALLELKGGKIKGAKVLRISE
ncbi:zinc-dependent alcohol dehydrogenase family protein [Salinimicrobium catena]|uniref:zinc-dependent alcohol dehydrogenase family protein n=1 Tax=Salinimicrobium catena TaxID=390640 RepID=UPI002FE46452